MGRILSIDYGTKRTGLAVTDPLKIIASPLDTIGTNLLFNYLKKYTTEQEVELIIVGLPKDLLNQETHATQAVEQFIEKLKKQVQVPIVKADERFTSKMAFQTMIDGGLKKKSRQNNSTIDKLSATIILQSYLEANPS